MEIEPGLIIYRPTEKLTPTTRFNYEVARTFMRGADMRRNIYIEVLDGENKKPNLRKPYTLIEEDSNGPNELYEPSWRITIDGGVIASELDSPNQLGTLNKTIKSALLDALGREKIWLHPTTTLGWFVAYGLVIAKDASWIFSEHPPVGDMLNQVALYGLGNGIAHFVYGLFSRLEGEQKGRNTSWSYIRNNPFEMFLPVIPVDKWIWGRYYLAQHGNELIIPKSENIYLAQ